MASAASKKVIDVDTKIAKAVSALIIDEPFFGSLLVRMKLEAVDGLGTMATDGTKILYDVDFVRQLSDASLKGIYVHELMHCIFVHQARRGDRDPRKWNIACDFAVNPVVLEAGYTLTPDALVDPQYKDMSAEQIYDLLPDDFCDGLGDGWDVGGVQDAESESGGDQLSQDEVNTIVQDWKNKVAEAANAAKMSGKLSAGLERLVHNILDSKLPWQELLARFMHAVVKNDFNWGKPNRTMMNNHHIYVPTLHNEACGSIVMAIDTSGSIGQQELDEFAAELNGVLDQVRPERVTVLYCDASINHVDEYKPDDYPVMLRTHGGGGTDFRPVFEHTDEHNEDVQCLIYLTDMMGKFPDAEPDYPVMWVSNSKIQEAPFGQVVSLK
jgi:predicted metal-dependent peptidase